MPTIQRDQEDLVIANFEQWKLHPVTRQLVENLKKRRKEYDNLIINDSVQVSKVTDQEFRHHGIAIRQIETCIRMCTDYGAFKIVTEK